MIDDTVEKPDITLTLDRDGVIRAVAPSDALANEALDRWRGQPLGQTVPPELATRVARAIEASQRSGESSCFQVRQRFPSGRELPFEYTTVSLGKNAGFIAVGRNLQNVSDLQTRLVDAQKAREQDYWRLREIETRYRAVLDASSEAVALVRVTTLRVVEANVAAARALGLVPGSEFFPDLSLRDRRALESTLDTVRVHGRAPSIALHLPGGAQWGLRATVVSNETNQNAFYLLQMSPLGGSTEPSADPIALEQILQRLPDAFTVVDREGVIARANHTFLDLVQVGVETAVVGQNLRRWLSQPGADSAVILGMVQKHGSVRMMRSRLEGDLGSSTLVEVSAVGDRSPQARHVGLVLRDVSARDARGEPNAGVYLGDLAPGLATPRDSMEDVVKASVETIERRCIEEALAISNGNRTAAARYLGLSRQSLHVKLNKYKLDLD